jgi:hypothetical protein
MQIQEEDDSELSELVTCCVKIHEGIMWPSRYALTTEKLKEGKYNSSFSNEKIKSW